MGVSISNSARNRADTNYRRKHKDQINIRIPKGQKALWQECAAYHGLSVNAMIVNAVTVLYLEQFLDVNPSFRCNNDDC